MVATRWHGSSDVGDHLNVTRLIYLQICPYLIIVTQASNGTTAHCANARRTWSNGINMYIPGCAARARTNEMLSAALAWQWSDRAMFTLYPTDTVGVGGVSGKATVDRLSASEYRSFTQLSLVRNVTHARAAASRANDRRRMLDM